MAILGVVVGAALMLLAAACLVTGKYRDGGGAGACSCWPIVGLNLLLLIGTWMLAWGVSSDSEP